MITRFKSQVNIGYLHLPKDNDAIQMSLFMYFNGDIVYETEET